MRTSDQRGELVRLLQRLVIENITSILKIIFRELSTLS